jgi:hypothetical protein
MSIVDHTIWPALRVYLRPKFYEKDDRYRIDMDTPPNTLWQQFLDTEMPCVKCARPVHPVRRRESWGSWFYAGTCLLTVTRGCARSRAAHEEYRRILAALKDDPPPQPKQSGLFDDGQREPAKWDLPCGQCGQRAAYYGPPVDHVGCVNRDILCQCGNRLGVESVRKDLMRKP